MIVCLSYFCGKDNSKKLKKLAASESFLYICTDLRINGKNNYLMKVVQSSILRAVIAVVVGVLLIKYRETMMTWLICCIGIMFFMSGLISCVVYYVENKRIKNATPMFDAEGNEIIQRKPFFPIVGLGSMILGLFLALMPNTFITYAVYLLGAILILGAINQLFSLARARQYSYVPILYWMFPCLTFIIAIWIMCDPMDVASLPLLATGCCFIFYGVIEAVNAFYIHRIRQRYTQESQSSLTPSAEIEDAEIVEE
jgi:uncharacterized membrane protein HdeD (DUF308 family)